MPSDDPELKEVEKRLFALVRCILEHAKSNATFSGQLKDILLSETLRAALPATGNTLERKTLFDPIEFLSRQGLVALRHELLEKPKSELAAIARQHRIANSKLVKDMEQNVLVDRLIAYSEQKLSQGGVFLKSDDSKPG